MFSIDKQSHMPGYLQLKEKVLQEIGAGRYLPGEKLPSVRALVQLSGLSHLTVARAISELVKDGHLVSVRGRGTFVTTDPQTPRPAKVDRRLHLAVLYGSPEGYPIDAFYMPFSYEVLNGVNAAASASGHYLHAADLATFFGSRPHPPVDGILLFNADNAEDWIERCLECDLPMVMIRKPAQALGANYVEADDYRGVAEAMQYLLNLGHRRIAFSRHAVRIRSFAERWRAYGDALRTHRLPVSEELVVPGRQSIERGQENMRALLELDDPPTAFLAGSDLEAAGAVRTAQALGHRVPEDISIVGFLGLDIMANHYPPLTTVCMPMRRMGFEAVKILERAVSGASHRPESRVFPTQLVVRGSTGSCARSSGVKNP